MNRRTVIASLSAGAAALGVRPLAALGDGAAANAGAPGPLNLITDVAALRVGQADDPKVRTGVTVIVPDERSVCAVDVRGGGPGTRETDVLNPWNLVHSVDAIVLSGGSVYGLAAADGVATWLGAHDRGFAMISMPGVPRSPIVPAAILYDLANQGNKDWGMAPPYRDLGIRAMTTAAREIKLGTAGAGYGAESGGLKGGTGSASFVTADGMTVGAIVAVNSLGSTVVPGGKHFWAAPLEIGKEFGGLGPSDAHVATEDWGLLVKRNPSPRTNTTIACIATDVELDVNEVKRVAMMAQDGFARAIRPIHSPFDGDVVFALSTARRKVEGPSREYAVARIGSVAADVLARAVARAIYEATLPPGMDGTTWHAL